MRHTAILAWRYVTYHRGKTAILIAAITLVVALPLAVYRIVDHYERMLTERAEKTPLLIGARGSRFDLAFHALYFRGKVPAGLRMAESNRILESDLAVPTPLHVRFTAKGYPVVGTTLEYFDERGLRAGAGTLPVRLGDCVLGSGVAAALDLGPGDRLISDPENVFDLAGQYPLNMRVSGVLAQTAGPDDGAVFVALETAWVIEGLGHGHEDLAEADDSVVLDRDDETIVANAALPQYQEITEENVESFHFHGDPDEFPVTAILAWPRDEKSETILRGRYVGNDTSAQALVPLEVVEELFGLVFRIKRFFDAQAALVAVSTTLFLALVVLLSLRLRLEERRTMHKIGCSRATVIGLHVMELGMILGVSIVLAGALAWIAIREAPRFLQAIAG